MSVADKLTFKSLFLAWGSYLSTQALLLFGFIYNWINENYFVSLICGFFFVCLLLLLFKGREMQEAQIKMMGKI